MINNVYCEIKDLTNLEMVFEKFLKDYNQENANKLNLVLFIQAIEHILRIIRVITTASSHCLLVGLGG